MSFDIFISYRRKEASTVANWLRDRLTAYRLPNELIRSKDMEPLSVYLDETYLRPDEDFWEDNIVPALDTSKYLLILITPTTFQSLPDGKQNWVQREVEHFSKRHNGDNIMFALVDADFDAAIPDKLRPRYSNPSLIDLRTANQFVKRTLPDSFLTEQVRSIAADLYEISASDMPILRREDEDRRRRRNTRIGIASIAALAIIIISGWQVNEADSDRREAELLATERGVYSEASRVLTAAEQALDRDPTIALALGMYAADKLSATSTASDITAGEPRTLPGLQPFFERVLKRRPASQVLVAEEREKAKEVELFPSNLFGVEALQFLSSEYILVHHRTGYSRSTTVDDMEEFSGFSTSSGRPGAISVWHIPSGERRYSSGEEHFRKILKRHSQGNQFVALLSDGRLKSFEMMADGSFAVTGTLEEKFQGMSQSNTERKFLAWTDEGKIFLIDQFQNELDPVVDFNQPILSASFSDTLNVVAAYHDDETISLVRLSDIESVTRPNSQIREGDSNSTNSEISETTEDGFLARELTLAVLGVNTQGKSPKVDLQFFPKSNVMVARYDGEGASIELIDLTSGEVVFEHKERFGDIAVNAKTEKFAIADGSSITQYTVERSSEGVDIEQESNWAISETDPDVGESQFLTYGPFGEYLLGANAPILQLVSAKPALVQLYHANEFRDNRIKDVHSALQLSSRNTPVLNGSFSDRGDKIALFLTNGKIQVFDVFPEQAVSVSTRSQDYFDSFQHLPLEDKAILSNANLPISEVMDSIAFRYHAGLNTKEIEEVETALASQQSLIDVLEFVWSAPGTIALQPGNTRDELPNLAYGTVAGFTVDSLFSSYDPLQNDILAGLADVALTSTKEDLLSLSHHYADAVEKDILLLTGVQIIPLLSTIETGETAQRRQAWVAIAFTGNIDILPQLVQLRKAETDAGVVAAADWAIDFLDTFGNSQALNEAAQFRNEWDDRKRIFATPKEIAQQFSFERFSHIPFEPAAETTILNLALDDSVEKPFPLMAQASLLFSRTNLRRSTQIGTDMNFAAYLRDKGLLEEALSISTQIVDREVKNERFRGQPENLHGFILYRLERYDEAIAYFEKSIKAGRPDGWPERNMAVSYEALGENDKAKELFEASLRRANSLFAGLEERRKAGEISQSQYDTTRAGVVDDFAGFYNAYAWFLVNIKDASEEEIRRAVELSETSNELTEFQDASFLDTLAHAYAMSGNLQKAIELGRQAVERAKAKGSNSLDEYRAKVEEWEAERAARPD